MRMVWVTSWCIRGIGDIKVVEGLGARGARRARAVGALFDFRRRAEFRPLQSAISSARE